MSTVPPFYSGVLNAADAVAELRAQPGQDIVILGSGDLVRALMHRGLIDRYVLLVHLLVLGSGRRLFDDDGTLARVRLADSLITDKGVAVMTYEPADPAER